MVVRMRHTRSQRGNSRSQKKLEKPALTRDGSGGVSLRHRASPVTGTYKGKAVLDLSRNAERKAAKRKEKLNASGKVAEDAKTTTEKEEKKEVSKK